MKNAARRFHRWAPRGTTLWSDQANAALRESKAFNRSIVHNSLDCIKVLDLNGRLLSMLRGQDLLGIEDIGPYLHTSWIDFWHGADRAAAHAAIEAAKVGSSAFAVP